MSTEIRDAFVSSHKSGADEDAIKLAMVKAGAPFKSVAKLYNELLVSEGIVESKETKDAKVTAACEGVNLSTEDGFNTAVDLIVETVKDTDERAAGCLVRWYARKNGLEFYTKPKVEPTNKRDFVKRFYAALLANPLMTEERAQSIILGEDGNPETSDGIKKAQARYQRVRALVNAVANGYETLDESDDIEEDDEE